MTRIDTTLDGKIMIYSGGLRIYEDRVGLASVLSRAIADNIGGYRLENISNFFFSRLAYIPGLHFLIGTLLWKKIFPYTLPYFVALAAYTWSQHDKETKHATESDYHALTIMCRAGYNMRKESLLFWKRNMEAKKGNMRQLELSGARMHNAGRTVS